ncbi:MAG TPA: hypothetical protein ENJ82_05585, partial [Bacteroidetes bacterium]|nr:hypothetical protein [Bacteroidota bacterium]
MNPNYRQFARFSSPETLPDRNGKTPERNLTKIFGAINDVNTENQERISNRLTYVHQLLKMRKTPSLTEAQRSNRTQLLNLLELYVMLGQYPSDYDQQVNDRLCFKDAAGCRCAVGFLVERSAGKHLADKVCDQGNLALLPANTRQEFEAWLADSGILREELAMIQPNFSGEAKVDTHAPNGVSQAFASLRKESQTRRGSYSEAEFVKISPEAVVLAGHQPAPPPQAVYRVDAAVVASATVANPSQLRIFFLNNQLGEPVVAMTYSSS